MACFKVPAFPGARLFRSRNPDPATFTYIPKPGKVRRIKECIGLAKSHAFPATDGAARPDLASHFNIQEVDQVASPPIVHMAPRIDLGPVFDPLTGKLNIDSMNEIVGVLKNTLALWSEKVASELRRQQQQGIRGGGGDSGADTGKRRRQVRLLQAVKARLENCGTLIAELKAAVRAAQTEIGAQPNGATPYDRLIRHCFADICMQARAAKLAVYKNSDLKKGGSVTNDQFSPLLLTFLRNLQGYTREGKRTHNPRSTGSDLTHWVRKEIDSYGSKHLPSTG